MDLRLKGKVAVVTGGSLGIGRAVAEAFSAQGVRVAIVARSREVLEQAAREITASTGVEALAVPADVSDTGQVEAAIQAVVDHFGRLDILVNNAGTEDAGDFVNVTEEQYDAIMGVNLRGAFFTAQAAARIMMRQRSGKILNVGSLGSAIGLAESSVYCGSKCGVVGVTRTMAIELAKYNVQVNAIGPGYFRTPMTEPFFQDPAHRKWIEERIPAGRVGTSDDLLGTVIFLCSPASDYLTGQIVYVDGGWLAS